MDATDCTLSIAVPGIPNVPQSKDQSFQGRFPRLPVARRDPKAIIIWRHDKQREISRAAQGIFSATLLVRCGGHRTGALAGFLGGDGPCAGYGFRSLANAV